MDTNNNTTSTSSEDASSTSSEDTSSTISDDTTSTISELGEDISGYENDSYDEFSELSDDLSDFIQDLSSSVVNSITSSSDTSETNSGTVYFSTNIYNNISDTGSFPRREELSDDDTEPFTLDSIKTDSDYEEYYKSDIELNKNNSFSDKSPTTPLPLSITSRKSSISDLGINDLNIN
jgi:gas vesicle protein